MTKQSSFKMKSVKSFHPCKSVIQTNYDIIKAHGGDPDRARRQAGSYREKVENNEGEGTEFIIQIPN